MPHASQPAAPYALVIHGGAGVIEREQLGAAEEAAIHADLARALDAGQGVLAAGGSALDAAVAAVVALE
ncbi:MAG TPA: isoaspartyl peptidase/L-asparaginase, partial [Luteimonas sp.]|nr:isoaspartyl peptidase/L-asparaginase [Luteimonas sp.]